MKPNGSRAAALLSLLLLAPPGAHGEIILSGTVVDAGDQSVVSGAALRLTPVTAAGGAPTEPSTSLTLVNGTFLLRIAAPGKYRLLVQPPRSKPALLPHDEEIAIPAEGLPEQRIALERLLPLTLRLQEGVRAIKDTVYVWGWVMHGVPETFFWSGRAAPDGTFAIPPPVGLRPSTVQKLMLEVWAPGAGQGRRSLDGWPQEEITIPLRPGRQLRGTLLNAAGAPDASLAATLTRTASDGRFQLPGSIPISTQHAAFTLEELPPGRYLVQLAAGGAGLDAVDLNAPETVDSPRVGLFRGTHGDLEPYAPQPPEREILLQLNGAFEKRDYSVTGQVVKLGAGAPVSASLVELLKRGSRVADDSAWSDAEGRFQLHALAAGQYIVHVTSPRHIGTDQSIAVPTLAPVRVELPAVLSLKVAGLRPGKSQPVVRTYVLSADGRVSALPMSPPALSDGSLLLQQPTTAARVKRLVVDLRAAGVGSSVLRFDGWPDESQMVQLDPGYSVSGFVRDANSQPVAGARVALYQMLNDSLLLDPQPVSVTSAANDGSFTFASAASGWWGVETYLPGSKESLYAVARVKDGAVRVRPAARPAGPPWSTVDLSGAASTPPAVRDLVAPELPETDSVVLGKVFARQTGFPENDVLVTLSESGHTIDAARTDANGSFRLRAPIGARLAVTAHGELPSPPVAVPGDGRALTLYVDEPLHLRLHLFMPNGEPLPPVNVSYVLGTMARLVPHVRAGVTAVKPGGLLDVSLDQPSRGDALDPALLLYVEAPGIGAGRLQLTRSGQLSLKLSRPSVVLAQVVDEDGLPLRDTAVEYRKRIPRDPTFGSPTYSVTASHTNASGDLVLYTGIGSQVLFIWRDRSSQQRAVVSALEPRTSLVLSPFNLLGLEAPWTLDDNIIRTLADALAHRHAEPASGESAWIQGSIRRDGRPARGVQVMLWGRESTAPIAVAHSDALGHFSFESAAVGGGRLGFVEDGYLVQTIPVPKNLHVQTTIPETPAIRLRVVTAEGKPPPIQGELTVSASSFAGTAVEQSQTVHFDEKGYGWFLPPLPRMHAAVTALDLWLRCREGYASLHLNHWPTGRLTVHLTPGFSLSGQILDSRGRPRPSCAVTATRVRLDTAGRLLKAAAAARGISSAGGRFMLEALSPGMYLVRTLGTNEPASEVVLLDDSDQQINLRGNRVHDSLP